MKRQRYTEADVIFVPLPTHYLNSNKPTPRFLNLQGKKFGTLTVLGYAGRRLQVGGGGVNCWWCCCECGEITRADTRSLTTGHTTSCGCAKRGAAARRCTTHGQAHRGQKQAEYNLWCNMIARCHREAHGAYLNYGGRGIVVCDRWRNDFAAFLADMGPRPSRCHSVERRDVDGNYEPGNCFWATPEEQAFNKHNTVQIAYRGETVSASEFGRRIGLSSHSVIERISRGESPEAIAAYAERRNNRKPRKLRGPSDTPTYRSWRSMIYRCHKPTDKSYPRYGARGITACQRWRDNFEAFLEDMGHRPGPEYSLDRIDNDGPYAPENCRWATREEQSNNRRCTFHVTFQGQTKPLQAWAAIVGLPGRAIRRRLLELGWPPERALTEPLHDQGPPRA